MEQDHQPLGAAFEAGIAYEVLQERINNEMARHNTLAHKFGLDSDRGRKHDEAMGALAEVRRRLDPNDPNLLEVVSLMLASSQSDHGSASTAA